MIAAEGLRAGAELMTDTSPGVPGLALSERAAFVRTLALKLEPQTDYTVAKLTTVLGKYVGWSNRTRGLPLVESLVLDTRVIDLFIRDSVREKRLAKSSVATYRSILLRASEILLPRDDSVTARQVPATSPLAPYSDSEIQSFQNWIRGQNTELKHAKAVALVSLGLGCGFRAREILNARADSVLDVGDGGIHVTVTGDEGARTVPMLERYHAQFRRLVQSREPGEHLFGSLDRALHKNSVSEFIASSGHRALRPNTYRMRSTWIIGRIRAGVDLPTLLAAADLDRLEKLGDYLPYLETPSDESRARLTVEVGR